jgi:hypothetical protein
MGVSTSAGPYTTTAVDGTCIRKRPKHTVRVLSNSGSNREDKVVMGFLAEDSMPRWHPLRRAETIRAVI